MAKELKTSLQIAISGLLQDALDLSTPQDKLSKSFRDNLATGAGKDQADLMWHDTDTLNSGNSYSIDIDLAGTLTDGLGDTVTFAKVKLIAIFNKATQAGFTLNVGGDATETAFINWVANFSDEVVVGPGGCFLLFNPSLAGYAVTAGSGDILQIANSDSHEIEFDVVIIGTSE